MEKYIMTEAEKIPVYREADVVVIGGGIAGIAAAVAAARCGKKTVLLEKNSALGGLATLGHVCIYLPLDDGRGHRVASGLAEELLYTSIRYSYNTMAPQWKFRTAYAAHPQGRYETTFNIPAAILAYDELCEEEGVETIFDVVFSEPIMQGSRVEGVIVESKQGRVAVLGKQFVDASGDADLMARAGAVTSTKDSICSHWAYETSTETARQALENGQGVVDMMQLRLFGARPHGGDLDAYPVPTFSGTTIDGVNGYLKTSRRMARDYLKEHFSDEYCMLTLPTMAQFRTSRHIVGAETLDYETDAERYRETSVGIISNGIGGPVVEPYEYPYGGLIDTNVENVFAAGRTVACDEKMGWEMMRLIPACALTGEAAGTAAAQAIEQNATAQTLDIKKLQEVLAENHVVIHIPEEMKGNAGQPTTVEADPRYQHKTHIRFSSAELNAGFKKMY